MKCCFHAELYRCSWRVITLSSDHYGALSGTTIALKLSACIPRTTFSIASRLRLVVLSELCLKWEDGHEDVVHRTCGTVEIQELDTL